jgi:hypothetical protein
MFGLSASTIFSLLWVGLFFVTINSFLRGMRALEQIATRLERIEHILTKGPPTPPHPSVSHAAT